MSRGILSQGTLLRGTLLWEILRDIDIWWYWVNIGRYWLVFGGTGSVWGSTGWYLVILGHFNLVLFGIKWYWVIKGLLCLYILKKLMVTSTNRPTDRPTNRQGEYRAICLFRKLENRKKAEICNNCISCHFTYHTYFVFFKSKSLLLQNFEILWQGCISIGADCDNVW